MHPRAQFTSVKHVPSIPPFRSRQLLGWTARQGLNLLRRRGLNLLKFPPIPAAGPVRKTLGSDERTDTYTDMTPADEVFTSAYVQQGTPDAPAGPM